MLLAAVTAVSERRIRATHGSFDNDNGRLRQTLVHIIGAAPVMPLDDVRGF